MSTRKYAVRKIDGKNMYYNPDVRGDRINPTFTQDPKFYNNRGWAEKAKEFCESGVNDHWVPARPFTPIPVEVVQFEVSIKEIKST